MFTSNIYRPIFTTNTCKDFVESKCTPVDICWHGMIITFLVKDWNSVLSFIDNVVDEVKRSTVKRSWNSDLWCRSWIFMNAKASCRRWKRKKPIVDGRPTMPASSYESVGLESRKMKLLIASKLQIYVLLLLSNISPILSLFRRLGTTIRCLSCNKMQVSLVKGLPIF